MYGPVGSFFLSDLGRIYRLLLFILLVDGLEPCTLILGMAITVSSLEVHFAVGTFLCASRGSLSGRFSFGILSFFFNITAFIRLVISRANGGTSLQIL